METVQENRSIHSTPLRHILRLLHICMYVGYMAKYFSIYYIATCLMEQTKTETGLDQAFVENRDLMWLCKVAMQYSLTHMMNVTLTRAIHHAVDV